MYVALVNQHGMQKVAHWLLRAVGTLLQIWSKVNFLMELEARIDLDVSISHRIVLEALEVQV
jgi:hypothetical protein